jgi:hypothetical protein
MFQTVLERKDSWNSNYWSNRSNSINNNNCNRCISRKSSSIHLCRSNHFSSSSWCRILALWKNEDPEYKRDIIHGTGKNCV